jgi:hypothetical protein
MRVERVLWVLIAGCVAVPGVAAAQETGQAGITMGYPESIGVIWHVTDTVAVRPEFAFAHTTSDSDLPFADTTFSSTSGGIGVSGLFYFHRADNLRPYFAPRWSYTHADPSQSASANTNTISGLFGAQYAVGKRFSVFGETGLSYSRTTAKGDADLATITLHGNAFGTRTGAGVIFYF